MTDRFHGANHLCSDEFKYNTHGLKGREEFPGKDNTSVSELINRLMSRFDRTEQRATINTGMLVYDFYIQVHNTDLLAAWPRKQLLQVRLTHVGLPLESSLVVDGPFATCVCLFLCQYLRFLPLLCRGPIFRDDR